MIKRLRLPFMIIMGLFVAGSIVTMVFGYGYMNTDWACKNLIDKKYTQECLNNQKQYHENNITIASVIMIGTCLGMPIILSCYFIVENRKSEQPSRHGVEQ